jgi:hypothetical protein
MKAVTTFSAVCAAVVVMAAMGAWAEVTVSVTLTGPIDEILPLLEHLREMGVGAATTDQEFKAWHLPKKPPPRNPLRLQLPLPLQNRPNRVWPDSRRSQR